MSEQETESGDKRLYFNTTDTPYRVDGYGRTLGGGEEGEYAYNKHIQYGLDQGWLVDKTALAERAAEQSEFDNNKASAEGDSTTGTSDDGPDAVQRNQSKSAGKQKKTGTTESQEK